MVESWDKWTLDQALMRSEQEDAAALIEAFRDEFILRFAPNSELILGDSARNLLAVTFKALAGRGFKEIHLCHYNCPVVRDAASQSGLVIRQYSVEMLWKEEAAAISALALSIGKSTPSILVIPHFFGRPSQVPQGLSNAQRNRVFIIEDCAHTLGGRHGNLALGTLFDAGIFSFNFDKPISLLGGGAIALASDAARALGLNDHLTYDDRPDMRRAMVDWQRVREVVRASTLKRRLYQIQLKFQFRQVPHTGFAFGPTRAALGLSAMAEYDHVQQIRKKNCQNILGGGVVQVIPKGTIPAPLRLRVLITDKTERAALQRNLNTAGILCGNLNWPSPIGDDTPEYDRMWADGGLDLPVDIFLRDEDIEILARELQQVNFRLP